MFSLEEKQKIAKILEEALIALNHPEMPKEKPLFALRVEGKEPWSFANIVPNWTFDKDNPPTVNPWNEHAREILGKKE
jgi:hypothetical protein